MLLFAHKRNPATGEDLVHRRSGWCGLQGYQCKVFVPVPATTESSAAFPGCDNIPNPSFLFAIA
ncbi:hypothetical protein GTQ43_04865 [Nostoc sp. KVJ3]|uniref:hypothetical protein n=1 Tax=Nostoc sp. KVJ3 TaxID=457945 RepID=UPI002238B57D|nr:hypothetical protein [Nostoc sp. KVJ3]MCW5313169.1 hypothetical protein [Nostoc sp. KVJ3]